MSDKKLLAISIIFENLGRDEQADPNIKKLLKGFKEAECLYGKPDIAMCVAAPACDVPKISEALKNVCTVERFNREEFGFYTPPGVNLEKFAL
jgi:hypothetical protein